MMQASAQNWSGALREANVGQSHVIPSIFHPHERIISTILMKQAARYGERTLLIAGRQKWSYTKTVGVAALTARHLAKSGIKSGDRVAILCSNRAEFLQVYLGCAWLGAIAVPINTASRGQQLTHVFANSSPKLLVIEDKLSSVVSFVADSSLLPPLTWTIREEGIFDDEAHALPSPDGSEIAEVPKVAPGDTVAILYTSGTTGPSKGVCCPQAQLFWWGVYSARALTIQEGDVLFTTLPLFHTNALNAFYQAVLNGCTYVLEPKFSVSRFWQQIGEQQATVAYLLGAMAGMLLSQPPSPFDKSHSLKVVLGGGVPSRFHETFLHRFGVPLLDGYASTETNFVFASSVPSEFPGTMGFLTDAAEAVIVDDDDNPVPDGTPGELLLRPTQPFSFATGYFAMPEKTNEAWRNYWFHTGDRVIQERDGHFRFIDRTKDAIRRRGENVSSWELEQVILTHPDIAACAIYPIASELGEDEIAVAIQLKPDCSLGPLDVVKHCEGQLAYFAIPRFVRFVEAMPLTENGKIRKVVFRKQGRTSDIWDRETAGYQVRR